MCRPLLASLLVVAPFLLAQAPVSPPQVVLPVQAAAAEPRTAPGIVIDDADPAAKSAVRLDGLKIHVAINGLLAQTTVTMTFRNTLGRQLEGTLEFPLPENAAVVGYALDVPAGSGTLVEGVCVEKERARRIFETEQRRGVDPGLVEQTRGNNYRTRVHPIPANGTRTVQLTYVSDLVATAAETRYTLPLEYAGNLASAAIAVEAVGEYKPEDLRIAGLPGMAFKRSEAGKAPALVAEKTFRDIKLGGALAVTMPPLPGVFARVERREKARSVENVLAHAAGPVESYFLVSMQVPAAEAPRREYARIGVIWDTSLSRAGADRTAELATLRGVAARFPNATFEVFSTEGVALKTFAARDAEGMVAYLKDLPCDGALRIDGLREKLEADRRADTTQPKPELYLFYTDGLVTLGRRTLGAANAPVFTVSSDPRADHGLLGAIAAENRGRYLNLQRLTPEGAVEALLAARVPVSLSWAQDELLIRDVYPAGEVVAAPGERVTFTGRLLAPAVTVTLNGREIVLKQDGASETGIVPRFWAQQKAAALGLDPVRNADALLAVGKDFGIVTPVTSLLVLETVDQYVRHRVVPPQSAKGLYDEFVKRIEAETNLAKKEEGEKIDRVLAMWNKRVEWWNKEFTPPTREQVAAAKAKETQDAPAMQALAGAAGVRSDAASSRPLAEAPQAGTPATPAPALRLNYGRGEMSGALRSESEMIDAAKQAGDGDAVASGATITIKPWSPDTPYLRALKAAKPEERAGVYLAQRKDYLASPAFYLDCANFFLEAGDRAAAVRILTNIAQLRLEDAPLLRIAAYRLLQIGEHGLAIDLFEQAKALRPDEPQSWRDLAQAYAARAKARAEHRSSEAGRVVLSDYARALDLLKHVVMNKWERFDEIEVIALMEANALSVEIGRLDVNREVQNPLDSRLVKNLDCDLRIVLTWDADVTDIDLHVVEPTTEEAFYGHNLTLSGGLVSRDFTQGYGPEEYVIHWAPQGAYKIMANYYGSQQQSIQGPVTVQATVITNFGRQNEQRKALTLRLTEQKETVEVGEVEVGRGR